MESICGSKYFNYKGSFSVVLMALVDHLHRFTVIDVGSYGRNSEGGIFSNSVMGKAQQKKLCAPDDKPLPGSSELGPMPHIIVGDEAFPLKPYLMRPYPGKKVPDAERIFNYRLSRARRLVENAFGILAARLRVYNRRIQLHPENIDKMIKATCVLQVHNFLQKTSSNPDQCDKILQHTGSSSDNRSFFKLACARKPCFKRSH